MALSANVIDSYNDYNYTGGMQSFTVPINGIYKLDVYGAQGGPAKNQTNSGWLRGGYGGYSIGYKHLRKGDIIYIYVGGEGAAANTSSGGYNGGGGAGKYSGGGGGCTHIATVSGTLATIGAGNISKVLIVAGGGGGGSQGNSSGDRAPGGAGGGLSGDAGGATKPGIAGTQTSGYAFGQGGSGNMSGESAGGGGGLYGGGAGDNGYTSGGSGGGGSGYIGGVPSFEYKGTTYSPSTSNGQRSGNGFARITLVSKLFPAMYYGDNQVSTMFFGDSEIDNIFYGDLQL